MAFGPKRHWKGAGIGAAIAIAVGVTATLGLFSRSEAPALVRQEAGFGSIPEGKLVLRVIAPQLY